MDHDPLHAPTTRSVAEHGTLAEAQMSEVQRVLLRNSVAALQHLAVRQMVASRRSAAARDGVVPHLGG